LRSFLGQKIARRYPASAGSDNEYFLTF